MLCLGLNRLAKTGRLTNAPETVPEAGNVSHRRLVFFTARDREVVFARLGGGGGDETEFHLRMTPMSFTGLLLDYKSRTSFLTRVTKTKLIGEGLVMLSRSLGH